MKRTVLVTGASSGIGLGIALGSARAGFEVVGLVVDETAAESLRAESIAQAAPVTVVVADLGDISARRDLASSIRPWALVNNAGYLNAGQVRDVSLEDARGQLEVMVLAPVDLILQVLPPMIERGQGRIVNVTSSAVHASTPLSGWYAACKAALREINDALRIELDGTGVDVVDVEPGGYRTGIWGRAASELEERKVRSSRPELYERVIARLGTDQERMGDPEDAARAVVDLLTVGRPPNHLLVGPGARWLRILDSVLPDRVWDAAASAVAGSGGRLAR